MTRAGTGKTYASAFAMRELGYRRVLFLVHRGQLARQTKKSYQKIFGKNVSMGLVGAGYADYDSDYVFAMVQTLNRDEHLYKYRPDEFECIILDEAHHSSADTYQKVMSYFKPKLWLGMTVTPDKRDGRYRYTYVGLDGNPQCIYSWKLEETDRLSAGKRPCESLRVKEKQVIRLKELGIKKLGDSKTVTKTNAGTRVIPITNEVADCFRKILKNRKLPCNEVGIKGNKGKVYKGFLYYDKNGMPMVALHWEKYFQHIVDKYNKTYKEELPKITPHICRHTYCSHMASSGVNPKHLQYLMGHSEISVTLDVYTHVDWDNLRADVEINENTKAK